MTTKLTLTIEDTVIKRAKAYAKQNNVSVSSLVETYLKNLTAGNESNIELSGVVAELAGVLKGVNVDNWQEDYAEHLSKKYQ